MIRILTCIKQAFWTFICAVRDQLAAIRREYIVEQYVRSGAVFGEALSYLYMGECVGFHGMKVRWAKLERLYAELGYRTIPVEDFLEYAGYGKALDHLIRVKRTDGEEAKLHAVTFQLRYEEGILPELDIPHQGEPSKRTCQDDRKIGKNKNCDGNKCGPPAPPKGPPLDPPPK